MTLVYFFAFVFAVAGIILLCRINKSQLTKDFAGFTGRKRTLEFRVKSARGEIKKSKLQILFKEIQATLVATHSETRFATICIASAIALFVAVTLCVAWQRFFIVPPAAVLAVIIPVFYIRNLAADSEKQFAVELETSLSIVTAAYAGSGDIVDAVSESISYMREPIKSVFARFLGRTKAVNCDIIAAIDMMKYEIRNDIFREWCDSLKECYRNSDLRYILQPTVMKFTDERIVNAQLETKLMTEKKSFYLMTFLVLANFPLIYIINKDWFSALVDTIQGQIATGVVLVICVLLTVRMKWLTRPVKYRR